MKTYTENDVKEILIRLMDRVGADAISYGIYGINMASLSVEDLEDALYKEIIDLNEFERRCERYKLIFDFTELVMKLDSGSGDVNDDPTKSV